MWFVIGLFVISLISFFVVGLCRAAYDGEEDYGKEVQN